MRCNVPARSLIEEGMLTLFYSPGACSLASHIALAESGLPYQAVRINTKNGDNCTPGYLRINRWGKVPALARSEEHTSELQSLMRISYAVFCLKKKKQPTT